MLKVHLIFLLVVALAFVHAGPADDDVREWVNFLTKFHKKYTDPLSALVRQRHFLRNLRRVRDHNKLFTEGRARWNMRLYDFSDESPVDFARKHFGTSRKFASKDSQAPVIDIPLARSEPPTTWDIRTQGPGKLTPVKNQQECGSCWAFATSGAIENAYSIAKGSLVDLSEQQQVDCNTACYGCDGGWFDQSFTYTKSGLTTQKTYPYLAKETTCKTAVTKPVKNTSYGVLRADDLNIKNYIMTRGACAVCVDASAWDTYGDGIFNGAGATPECNHAVVLIGWGPGYWLIRNSWSAEWGEAGHIRVANAVEGGMFKDTVYCPVI